MRELSEFPLEELQTDLAESIEDIAWCRFALYQGVTTYGGDASVQRRLEVNVKIKTLIEAEIARRVSRNTESVGT